MNMFSNFGIIRRLQANCAQPIARHLAALYFNCDPLQPIVAQGKPCKFKNHLYLPIAMMLFTVFYGIVGLEYEATGSVDWQEIAKSPYIFSHQIAPTFIWNQMDILSFFDFSAALLIYVTLLYTQPIVDKFQLYIDESEKVYIGKKVLEPENKEKLLKLRKLIKGILIVFLTVFYIALVIFYYANLLINDVYETSFTSAIYWSIIPATVMYLLFALFGTILYIILAIRYIRILQSSLLAQFSSLNQSLKNGKLRFRARIPLFKTYLSLNASLVSICSLIRDYSRYSSYLLSIIFPFYIILQCYFLYILIFVQLPLVQAAVFYFSILQFNLFLFAITRECAVIDQINRQLEKANRVFYVSFKIRKGFRGMELSNLLTVESLLTPGRLHLYTFTIFAHHRITSGTYFVIISYIGVFFIYLAKDYYKKKLNAIKGGIETFI